MSGSQLLDFWSSNLINILLTDAANCLKKVFQFFLEKVIFFLSKKNCFVWIYLTHPVHYDNNKNSISRQENLLETRPLIVELEIELNLAPQ
jgi:hypothetical protein